MFVNGEYKDVYDKKTLDFVIAEAGFDPEELFAAMLSYSNYHNDSIAKEGLLGDDKWSQEEEINDCIYDLKDIISRLQSNSRKGNTKCEIAHDLAITVNNLEGCNSYCQIYDARDFF